MNERPPPADQPAAKRTMLSFFPVAQGPAPAPESGPAKPPNLFPINERCINAPDKTSMARLTYKRVQSVSDGTLRGECCMCTKPPCPIDEFAPAESNKNFRRLPEFVDAVKQYETAYEAGDLDAARKAREKVGELRNLLCPSCAKSANELSPAAKACKDAWDETRKQKCEEQGGCARLSCPMRGDKRDFRVLQGNHLDPNTKVHHPSDYPWWSCEKNGGVDAQREEFTKCEFICGFCHNLEETSNTGRRCGDPKEMPDGKTGKTATKEERAQYEARRHANHKFPKQDHVDKQKLRIGCCQHKHCARKVTEANCVAFAFDHIDETTKMKGKDTLAGERGGVCGLVNNCAKRASLDKIKPTLDAEMAKCQLLCDNCHHLKTWYGLVIEKA